MVKKVMKAFEMDVALNERLADYCNRNGVKVRWVIERAIEMHLDRLEKAVEPE